MLEFILNNQLIQTKAAPGESLLDFIRYTMDLPGTKSGCREGDCGACTVMEGSFQNGEVKYKTIVSCLTPLGNVHGKHIVTIEGLNMSHLSPAQKAIVDNGATQCGFCTPGFVVSLTTHQLSTDAANPEKAIESLNGNICRCTGYKSIEKAAISLSNTFKGNNTVEKLVQAKYLPAYFTGIAERLQKINTTQNPDLKSNMIVGGGTDLLVQQPDRVQEQKKLGLLSNSEDLKGIQIEKNICTIGAAMTATEIYESSHLQQYFSDLKAHFKLISSTPIRNMGTLGGNLVNASPIGDLSIFFLALNANILLQSSVGGERRLPLNDFFIGYKKIDLNENEIVKSISFRLPEREDLFNFEKVSKRQHLDIASVNTAIHLREENGFVQEIHISAGGVSPIPLLLSETATFLIGKRIDEGLLLEANKIMQQEISPISDIRGSESYKRLLLRQLLFAHFIGLKPVAVDLVKKLSQ